MQHVLNLTETQTFHALTESQATVPEAVECVAFFSPSLILQGMEKHNSTYGVYFIMVLPLFKPCQLCDSSCVPETTNFLINFYAVQNFLHLNPPILSVSLLVNLLEDLLKYIYKRSDIPLQICAASP